MRWSLLLACQLSLVIAGCGGDYSGTSTRPPANAPPPVARGPLPQEAWAGHVTSNRGASVGAFATLNGWGELRLVTDRGQWIGFLSETRGPFDLSMNAVATSGSAWPGGETVTNYSISGEIGPGFSLNGHYEGPLHRGSFFLDVMTLSWESDAVWPLEGQWMLRDENQNIVATFTISTVNESIASIAGNDINGCVYDGEVDAWTSLLVYDIFVSVANCPSGGLSGFNGNYDGTGIWLPESIDATDPEQLLLAVSNDVSAMSLRLER